MPAHVPPGLVLALQIMAPGRWDLLFALLGIVLGPVAVWQSAVSLKNGEGDFDRELAPRMRLGAIVVLLAGLGVTVAAGLWLVKWLPEYLLW